MEGDTFQTVGLDAHERMTEAHGLYGSAGTGRSATTTRIRPRIRWFDKALARPLRGFT